MKIAADVMPQRFGTSIALAFRLALREMRGGLKGFYIFLACIALGTAAIAGVNSLSQSITGSISSQGRELLAGDIRFQLNNRVATDEEKSFLDASGTLSQSSSLRVDGAPAGWFQSGSGRTQGGRWRLSALWHRAERACSTHCNKSCQGWRAVRWPGSTAAARTAGHQGW